MKRLATCGLLVLLGLAGSLPAQTKSRSHDPVPGQAQSREKMEALMVWRLTEDLNLSEEQTTEFFPRLRQLRQLRQEHHVARRALYASLSAAVNEKPVNVSTLKALIDSLQAVEDNFIRSDRQLRQEMQALLTIEQQARWLVFQANFDRQARRTIQQLRKEPGADH